MKVFENNWEYFSEILLKKSQIHLEIFVFLGESFLPPERKQN